MDNAGLDVTLINCECYIGACSVCLHVTESESKCVANVIILCNKQC